MTTSEMWKAAELMKASRSSDQRIAGSELERLARIFELAERELNDINFLPVPLKNKKKEVTIDKDTILSVTCWDWKSLRDTPNSVDWIPALRALDKLKKIADEQLFGNGE